MKTIDLVAHEQVYNLLLNRAKQKHLALNPDVQGMLRFGKYHAIKYTDTSVEFNLEVILTWYSKTSSNTRKYVSLNLAEINMPDDQWSEYIQTITTDTVQQCITRPMVDAPKGDFRILIKTNDTTYIAQWYPECKTWLSDCGVHIDNPIAWDYLP